jgi:hypothetical protein
VSPFSKQDAFLATPARAVNRQRVTVFGGHERSLQALQPLYLANDFTVFSRNGLIKFTIGLAMAFALQLSLQKADLGFHIPASQEDARVGHGPEPL